MNKFTRKMQTLLGKQKRLPAPDYSTFGCQHLLGIEHLDVSDIQRILDCAEHYIARNRQIDKKHAILKGQTLINLFFEPSTRTRTSFEIAGKRLGMDVINVAVAQSSASKGESLIDTAKTLDAMQADAVALRHSESGAAALLSRHVSAKVINAGDGSHEHPTQALLDALTIRRRKQTLDGVKVAICGDILHSRVARSNIILLKRMGADVTLICPSTLLPAQSDSFGVNITSDMQKGLQDADVVMVLRLQFERMKGTFIPSVREYFDRYGLDEKRLSYAKENALILHPGPMNRGVEIDHFVADHIERSAILDQVETGVAIRQSILELLLTVK